MTNSICTVLFCTLILPYCYAAKNGPPHLSIALEKKTLQKKSLRLKNKFPKAYVSHKTISFDTKINFVRNYNGIFLG